MNSKINLFRFFFESDKYSESPAAANEDISDFFPALVYIYDIPEKKLRFTNKQFKDFFGEGNLEPGSSEYPVLEFIHPEDVGSVQKELQRLYQSAVNDDSVSFSCRMSLHGHWCDFKTIGNVLRRDSKGKAVSILFIAQDVTAELKNSEEIAGVKKIYHDTEDLLQFGSWSWDVGKNRITWTNGLYKLMEYTHEELGPDLSFDFYMSHVSPEHTSMVNQLLQVAIREKNEFACEYDLFTKSGKLKTVSTMGKVISNGEGTVEKVLGITRDITTFKNFEKERERSFQELNRINKELEEFAYIASHDLQEPLRKITMFSERLRASCHDALNDNSKLYMDRIQSAAEAMRILIDNLLDYSRTSRGPQKFEKVELKKIFQEVISELELKIDESMTHIKVNELPEIEAVYAEMKQLFANLLNNAIKFRKPGSESKIEIESNALSDVERRSRDLPEGNYHKIQVRDWGIGFEQQYADKIFQIFQRLHGKKEYPGSGIGLAICKKVVDNHHGLIYAESEPEKGATFAVILPEKQ